MTIDFNSTPLQIGFLSAIVAFIAAVVTNSVNFFIKKFELRAKRNEWIKDRCLKDSDEVIKEILDFIDNFIQEMYIPEKDKYENAIESIAIKPKVSKEILEMLKNDLDYSRLQNFKIDRFFLKYSTRPFVWMNNRYEFDALLLKLCLHLRVIITITMRRTGDYIDIQKYMSEKNNEYVTLLGNYTLKLEKRTQFLKGESKEFDSFKSNTVITLEQLQKIEEEIQIMKNEAGSSKSKVYKEMIEGIKFKSSIVEKQYDRELEEESEKISTAFKNITEFFKNHQRTSIKTF